MLVRLRASSLPMSRPQCKTGQEPSVLKKENTFLLLYSERNEKGSFFQDGTFLTLGS